MTKTFLLPLLLVACLCAVPGCGGPAQVIEDEDCFTAVDALWTAVTSRKTALLDNVAKDLDRLYDEDKLPEEGHAQLEAIIAQARSGEWEPAAKKLKRFIQGQRRVE